MATTSSIPSENILNQFPVRMRIVYIALLLYASEVLSSEREKRQEHRCSLDSFRCHNGQCIKAVNICDGAIDCRDGSDETLATCSKLSVECPAYAFRCAYGACVDKKSKCNGVQDCADNSDELLPECGTRPSTLANNELCKRNEFTCNSGQCIDEFSLCDGASDCYDGSDETITQCIDIRCRPYSFQCAYGGCIDKSKKCNGVEDCKDGSDEDPEICRTTPERPHRTTTIRPRPIRPPDFVTEGCELPEKPVGGDYVILNCDQDDRSTSCQTIPGRIVKPFSILRFSCKSGYVLSKPSRNSVCEKSGNWDPEPPECQQFCPPLESDSVDLVCVYLGSVVNCSEPMRPGTKVRTRCKPAYHIADVSTDFTETECLEDGTWVNPITQCTPDCGIKNTPVQQLISNAPTSNNEYPWHAGLYRNYGDTYICGGSIIHPKAILTAAHCIYDEELHKVISVQDLRVSVGKYRRSWRLKDPNEQRFQVKEIIKRDTYLGKNNRYEHDIAILSIAGTITVKPTVMPVCIDKRETYSLYKEDSALGTVVGWGNTERGSPSDELRVAHFPYYDFHRCRAAVTVGFSQFITYDKFCAGLPNGTHLGQGDSGGGLTFSQKSNGKEVHFVYGIVSITDVQNPDITAFTNVTTHVPWLDKVLSAIKRSKM